MTTNSRYRTISPCSGSKWQGGSKTTHMYWVGPFPSSLPSPPPFSPPPFPLLPPPPPSFLSLPLLLIHHFVHAGYELLNEPWAGDIYTHLDQLEPRMYATIRHIVSCLFPIFPHLKKIYLLISKHCCLIHNPTNFICKMQPKHVIYTIFLASFPGLQSQLMHISCQEAWERG